MKKLIRKIIWTDINNEMPPKHKDVWLYNVYNDNYGAEFVHEFDLTTDRYKRNWTHWAEVKSPNK